MSTKTIADLEIINTPDDTANLLVQDPTMSIPIDRRWPVSSLKALLINAIRPVGSQYRMVAVAASNDPDVAFPVAQRPETMWPDTTWELLWADESVYYRTEGTDADDGRTDGLQLDQMQKITGSLSASVSTVGLVADAGGVSGAFSLGTERSLRLGTGTGTSYDTAFDSADSPDARTSTDTDGETRVTNRLERVYRRTA